MPPNAGAISFEDLESTFDLRSINSKFTLPAQHSAASSNHWDWDDNAVVNETEKEEEKKEYETADHNGTSDSYWEWSTPGESASITAVPEQMNKEEFIKQVLLEEEIRQCLSVDRIERGLREDADRRKQNVVECEHANNCCNEEMESYWYWDASNKRGCVIRRARLDLGVQCIEKRLLDDAEKRQIQILSKLTSNDVTSHDTAECNAYWEWEEEEGICERVPVAQEGVNKEELVKMIMLEEEIRQGLMVDKIQNSLLNEVRIRAQERKEEEVAVNNDSECGYWAW